MTDAPLPRPLADGSAAPPVASADAVLFDLDGVLYVGPEAVPGVPEVVTELRRRGVAVAYVTNNASRTPERIAAQLSALGIPATDRQVVTSAQAVARLVAETVPSGAPVLVVGGEGLREALVARGLRPVSSADESPVAVVQGYAPEVGWPELAEGAFAVRAGVPWFASNLDSTLPTPRGLAPGNGALVAAIATATGRRPVAAGKPELPLHREAVARTGAKAPLVVGDRLDTDIEGAVRAGVMSLLVLTGVATAADLVLAPVHQRPSFVTENLRTGLLAGHPSVTVAEGGGRCCGGWVARCDEEGPSVHGEGARIDALRALAVAVWEGKVDGLDRSAVDAALARAGW